MKRALDLVMFDNLNTSQRYEVLYDIYNDLFQDIIDFADISKKMNIFEEQMKRLKETLDIVFNMKKEN